MSGLEVTGVVLGALPLVISALEHYAEGINTAKRFWMYKIELRTLILQINTERSIFTNTVEQLLTGIVRIEQMTDFVAGAGSQAWGKQDINDGLKDRLRGAYDVYVENVKGMEIALRKIMEKLALDPAGKIALDLASSILQLYKTPWLDEWDDNDVYFVQRPGAKPITLYEHPYVYREFPQTASKTGQKETKYRVIRNQTLYSLGVLLIELWYGKSIEQLQAPPDLDCAGTPGITWCTAERPVDSEFAFEAGKRYSNAVR
ncbi:hypothetical protein E8E12_010603 [Didymella heteroderae]|uniref:DUF7580 domain-containing protein n=1 Tax=Didymella heteroderae TaxID=1769908 RepID=A0A9P4X0F5_9PLEO|nr:hypothetical protein E8E12_010603 [Didymella heteroderae]